MSVKPRRHIVIPDTQVKPGVPLNHLMWAGKYIAEKKPDVVVHLGDHYDFPSLSQYDKGTLSSEGRRYRDDINAGNLGFKLLTDPITSEISRISKNKKRRWNPDLRYLIGNHEERCERAVQADPVMFGTIGYHEFEHPGWQRHGFLDPVWIDNICFSHYFANQHSGRPIGGQSIDTRLKTLGHSFVAGHQQTLMFGRRETLAGAQHGLVAGAYYLHDEKYRGPQSNGEWRGLAVFNDVVDGSYDLCLVSMDYLCNRYEGINLPEFLLKEELHIVYRGS